MDAFGIGREPIVKSSQSAEIKTARLVARLRRQQAHQLADTVVTFAAKPAEQRMRAGVPKQGKNYVRMARRFLQGDKARPQGAEGSKRRRYALPAHRSAFQNRITE